MTLRIYTYENKLQFVFFVLVSHEVHVVDLVLDWTVENQRHRQFGAFDLLEDFLVVFTNELLEIVDELEGFVGDAFEVLLDGGEDILEM